jgi:peroxiredoxin
MGRIPTRWLPISIFLFFLSAPPALAQAPAFPVGSSLPMMDRSFLNATDGTTTTLAELTGRVGTVVVFYCNHCLWVEKYEDRLLHLAGRYKPSGIAFILVNANDPANFPMDSFAKSRERVLERHYEMPYLMDPDAALAEALGAERTPQVYAFDARHRLVYVGAIDDAPQEARTVKHPYLHDALQALVSGSKIAVPVTKPFGCSIRCRLDN